LGALRQGGLQQEKARRALGHERMSMSPSAAQGKKRGNSDYYFEITGASSVV